MKQYATPPRYRYLPCPPPLPSSSPPCFKYRQHRWAISASPTVWFGSPYGIGGHHRVASSSSPCSGPGVAGAEAAARSFPSPASCRGGGRGRGAVLSPRGGCPVPVLCWEVHTCRPRGMAPPGIGHHPQTSPAPRIYCPSVPSCRRTTARMSRTCPAPRSQSTCSSCPHTKPNRKGQVPAAAHWAGGGGCPSPPARDCAPERMRIPTTDESSWGHKVEPQTLVNQLATVGKAVEEEEVAVAKPLQSQLELEGVTNSYCWGKGD